MKDLRKSKTFVFSFDLDDQKQVEVLEAFASLAKGKRASALCNLVRSVVGESANREVLKEALKCLVYGPISNGLEQDTIVQAVTLSAVESPEEPEPAQKKWNRKLNHLAATAPK